MRAWLLAALACPAVALAVPMQFQHQGRLMDAGGEPVNGPHTLTLELWTLDVGGSTFWSETHTDVEFADGFYAVNAGSVATLDSTDFDGSTRYLAVRIDSVALAGRTAILSVPYAARAGEAEAIVAGGDIEVGRVGLASEVGAASTDACAGVNEGTIRWTGLAFEGCTPDGWVMLTNGRLGMNPSNPASTCKAILNSHPAVADGLYWLDPAGNDPFQAWCFMTGDYPGSTLAIRRPGSVAGFEMLAGDLNLPCTPSSSSYCRLSDVRINALRAQSTSMDAYIVRSYKGASGAPYCQSFARQTCIWNSDGAASSGCENSVVRNSGQYCSREQTTAGYRGIDGHRCPNLVYGGVSDPNNPFMIFEHSGGTHYCGGWDTTWNHITLSVQ